MSRGIDAIMHAAANPDDILNTKPLCGYTPEGDESAWTGQMPGQVTCAICLSMMGADVDAVAQPEPDSVVANDTFGSNWTEIWLGADHTFALCPTCHAVVHKYVWAGGNTLRDHWCATHPVA